MAAVIVHPTDFSSCAEAAEAQAVRLAPPSGAAIHLYGEGVVPGRDMERFFAAARKWVEEQLEARAAGLRARGADARWLVRTGVPAEEIVKVAQEEGADMIVMGTHGRGQLERLMMGSVADRVVRLAACPVLTVRAPRGEE